MKYGVGTVFKDTEFSTKWLVVTGFNSEASLSGDNTSEYVLQRFSRKERTLATSPTPETVTEIAGPSRLTVGVNELESWAEDRRVVRIIENPEALSTPEIQNFVEQL